MHRKTFHKSIKHFPRRPPNGTAAQSDKGDKSLRLNVLVAAVADGRFCGKRGPLRLDGIKTSRLASVAAATPHSSFVSTFVLERKHLLLPFLGEDASLLPSEPSGRSVGRSQQRVQAGNRDAGNLDREVGARIRAVLPLLIRTQISRRSVSPSRNYHSPDAPPGARTTVCIIYARPSSRLKNGLSPPRLHEHDGRL